MTPPGTLTPYHVQAPPFALAAQRMSQTVWAVILREFRAKYGNRRLGFLWAFAEPLAYIVTLTFFLTLVRGRTISPLGSHLAPFVTLGLMTIMTFSRIETLIRTGIKQNRGLLKYPRVRPFSLYVGRFLLQISTLLIVFTAIFTVFIVFGMIGPPDEPIRLLPPLLAAAFMGVGVGLINAIIVAYFEIWDMIYKPVGRVIFYTSGLFYLASSFPPPILNYLQYQPLLHVTEWARSAYYPNFESTFLDPGYPLWCALIIMFVGLLASRVFEERILALS